MRKPYEDAAEDMLSVSPRKRSAHDMSPSTVLNSVFLLAEVGGGLPRSCLSVDPLRFVCCRPPGGELENASSGNLP